MTRTPVCRETPPLGLLPAITPTEDFYVRENFPRPEPEDTFLVDGAVARPIALSTADLVAMAGRTFVTTMECAGNGRASLEPPVAGEQWGLGAVGTASWTGVPLRRILELAQLESAAIEIVFEAADGFARSLSVADAASPEPMVVHAMNEAPLTHEHGGPMRLVVPGWYGMASVKWLCRVTAVTAPFRGTFQVEKYVIDGVGVREMEPRAVIHGPREGQEIVAGPLLIVGRAWCGGSPLREVQVRVDGGAWREAAMGPVTAPFAWREFALNATVTPGNHVAEARAVTMDGREQPLQPRWNRLGYCNNAVTAVRFAAAPPSGWQPPVPAGGWTNPEND